MTIFVYVDIAIDYLMLSVLFSGDILKSHICLGFLSTFHSAIFQQTQGQYAHLVDIYIDLLELSTFDFVICFPKGITYSSHIIISDRINKLWIFSHKIIRIDLGNTP